ncbi:NAD(P)/FAD-dependent oxidoreductase [Solibacillus sp. FSL H8-0538]|uniref:NAD(P)/FAD-dependent oxidoreductase n=1 Tax=Solibacillus sp. FSL H8-0538 TaxID=2921400 RepID=UPI0030FC0631
MQNIYDITIVGGGPAGLYSSFYSGLRGMKTKIIEFQPKLGGKVQIYPEKMIWDVGGMRPTLGQDFVKELVQQGLTFDPTVCLNTKVEYIEKIDGLFVITTNSGMKHVSKAVILANGGGIISPIKLDIQGAEKFEMTNLHYTVQHLERFSGKHILISGGGNAAIDWAVELLEVAASVKVIYRKEQLSAHEAQVQAFIKGGGQIFLNASIQSLVANNERTCIKEVVIETGYEKVTIAVDDVLINHGYNRESSFEFAADLQPKLKDDYYYVGTGRGKLSVDGLFAAGDIISYEGKINLLVGAFQDAVNAVNSVKKYLEPSAYEHAMVSSHNDVFKERNKELLQEKLVKML